MIWVRAFSQQRHVPRLRRLKSFHFVFPALPHWAKLFRAYGAVLRITNQKLLTTRCYRPRVIYGRFRFHHNKAAAPEARHNVAQPGRAGNASGMSPAVYSHRNSKHRRCDTLRSRIVSSDTGTFFGDG